MFFVVTIIGLSFLISTFGNTEKSFVNDVKLAGWEKKLVEPFEKTAYSTTRKPYYQVVFNKAVDKIFKRTTKENYRNKNTVYVVSKYFHYSFTMKREESIRQLLLQKLPIIGKYWKTTEH